MAQVKPKSIKRAPVPTYTSRTLSDTRHIGMKAVLFSLLPLHSRIHPAGIETLDRISKYGILSPLSKHTLPEYSQFHVMSLLAWDSRTCSSCLPTYAASISINGWLVGKGLRDNHKCASEFSCLRGQHLTSGTHQTDTLLHRAPHASPQSQLPKNSSSSYS